MNVSQSLIKDFHDYVNGEACGLQIVAKYVDKAEVTEPSDAMTLGCWFEFMATGALPKNGKKPVAEYLKDGVTYSVKYRRMEIHVETFKKVMDFYGFKIISAGKRIVIDGSEGTIDLEVELTKDIEFQYGEQIITLKKGDRAIIDLKTTGLIDDKWSAFGWDIETLGNKEHLMVQAVHYSWLGKRAFKRDYHFLFNVYSSTNEFDSKLIYVPIQEEKFITHSNVVANVGKRFEAELERGFRPAPELKRCRECLLKPSCKYAIDVPQIQTVFY